jgi:hypothetical protein
MPLRDTKRRNIEKARAKDNKLEIKGTSVLSIKTSVNPKILSALQKLVGGSSDRSKGLKNLPHSRIFRPLSFEFVAGAAIPTESNAGQQPQSLPAR